jgi:hypothetical protein
MLGLYLVATIDNFRMVKAKTAIICRSEHETPIPEFKLALPLIVNELG